MGKLKNRAMLETARKWLWEHIDIENDMGSAENTKGAWAVMNWALGDAVSKPPWEKGDSDG